MAKSGLTIGTKLMASFAVLLLSSVTLGVVSWVSSSRIDATLQDVVNHASRTEVLASSINTEITEMISQLRGMEVRALLKDHALLDKYHQDYRQETVRLNEDVEALRPLIYSVQGKEFFRAITETTVILNEVEERTYKHLSEGDIEGGVAMYRNEFMPPATALRAEAQKFLVFKSGDMMERSKLAEGIQTRGRIETAIMLAICGLIGGVGIWNVRQITRSLRLTAQALSEGSQQISDAASQVSSSSEAVARGSSEQAAFIEQTSASSEQVNSMTRHNGENSTTAAVLVAESQTQFEATTLLLIEMVAAMDGINASSEAISKIIMTIDQIAFQTNILALNASVEAARAGESGMGFAVVAEEVRNLAHRSAQAAKDTAALIEQSITRSRDGKFKVDQIAEAIRSITTEASKIKTLVDTMSHGNREQTQGINEISKAIHQMEKVTQGNAASAQQTAAAAAQLTSQSLTVRAIVDHLTGMVGLARPDGLIESILIDQQRSSRKQGTDSMPPARTSLAILPPSGKHQQQVLPEPGWSDF